MTGADDLRHDLLLFLIVDIVGQMRKILFRQDLIQMGGRVEQTDLLLQKTMTFFPADITGVFAFRAGIVHLQIVSRVTGGQKKPFFLSPEQCQLFF